MKIFHDIDEAAASFYRVRWTLIAFSPLPIVAFLLIRQFLVIPGTIPIESDAIVMKLSFIAVVWLWGGALFGFWFDPERGVFRHRKDRDASGSPIRTLALVFICAYVVLPLVVLFAG